MSRLTLKFKSTSVPRLDLSGLMPVLAKGAGKAEIEKFELPGGRSPWRLADLFAVSGTVGGDVAIETGSALLDGVGAGLTSGTLTVEGSVGANAGFGMKGGRLDIKGNAGDYLASAMKGGIIHISGSAGDYAGAAATGHRFGMTGGSVVVDGSVGMRAGDKMRRGLILVRGKTGVAPGSRMIGGTIIAEGGLGKNPGELMRRGTLVAPSAERMLPTFADCGPHELVILSIMWRAYARELGPLAPKAIPRTVRRFAGDLAAIGKGEVLMTA